MLNILNLAFSDIRRGIQLRHLWIALASEDITDQHRRTSLGPIWLLVNYLVYVITFIIMFGNRSEIPNFISYMSIGLLVFQFLQEIITLGVSIYVREESFISGTPLPMSVYVLRQTMQSLIRSGYSTLGCFFILMFWGAPIAVSWFFSLVGVALILMVTPALIIIFGTLGAFFPDMQFVVGNLIRVGLFLTPIFWYATEGLHGKVSTFNPLTHFVNAVRTPIVDGTFPFHAVGICVAITIVAWIMAIFLLGKFHKKIVFLLS